MSGPDHITEDEHVDYSARRMAVDLSLLGSTELSRRLGTIRAGHGEAGVAAYVTGVVSTICGDLAFGNHTARAAIETLDRWRERLNQKEGLDGREPEGTA